MCAIGVWVRSVLEALIQTMMSRWAGVQAPWNCGSRWPWRSDHWQWVQKKLRVQSCVGVSHVAVPQLWLHLKCGMNAFFYKKREKKSDCSFKTLCNRWALIQWYTDGDGIQHLWCGYPTTSGGSAIIPLHGKKHIWRNHTLSWPNKHKI